MTENGPGSYDEINHVPPGFNSGWEKLIGPDARNANNASDLVAFPGSHYADPKFSWMDTVGPTAIIFLDSDNLGAQYENDAFVGDINKGYLYRYRMNGSRDGFVFSGGGLADRVADNSSELNETILATGFAGITDLKIGPDGRLYIVSFGDGKIYAMSAGASVPLAFGTQVLTGAEVGVGYNIDLNISGGTEPYNVALSAGSLPDGLLLSGQAITGAPTRAGGSRFSLTVSDQAGVSVTKRFHIPVVNAVAISNSSLPSARAGRGYKVRLKTRAGKKPFTWSLAAGTLPSGFTFDAPGATIGGIPLAPGESPLTFRVTDSLGGTVERVLILSVR